MSRYFMPAVLVLVCVAGVVHADGLGAGQPIMDMVISVLRQLMVVVIDFIHLVLGELVGAIKSLLPDFGFSK